MNHLADFVNRNNELPGICDVSTQHWYLVNDDLEPTKELLCLKMMSLSNHLFN